MTIRLGVLISGSGSNLQAFIDAIAGQKLDATIELVISSREGVGGVDKARNAGIGTVEFNPSLYADAAAVNERIRDEFIAAGAEYIVMAGYMRKLGTEVLDAFPDRVLNLHPALLPSFPGAHAVDDALRAGVKVTGVTVHFANEVYDEGPIIAQQCVNIVEGDTVETLASRIHEAEHVLYPATMQLIAQNRVTIDAHRIVHIAE